MATYMAKPGEVPQRWLLIDATDQVVGRLASRIAVLLMGKHRPTYTPHVDTGDFVVVLNADKVKFSGKKWEQKEYRWYTGYPGQKSVTAQTRLERKPELILREAVRRTNRRARVEISGGVTLERLPELAGTGADFVSVGAVTHSAPAVDISFEIEPV